MHTKRKIIVVVKNILAFLVSFISMVPLILILFNSFKTSQDAADMTLSFPSFPLLFENYTTVIEQGKLIVSFGNSMLYSCGSVILTIILAAMASYIFSRNKTKLNRFLYLYLILGITMPVNYVALFKVMSWLGLINSQPGLILLYTAMQLPFSAFLIYGFVGQIPRELDEAAIIDGCKPIQVFGRIVLPLLKPAIATASVLVFLNTWNEFSMPLYFMTSSTKWPMTLSVYNFFGMYFTDWNLICADIVLTSLPVITIYLLGQKYIVSGMTAGSVKG
ncbi:MAG: carbohydrate ABC transporter permease [Eubacteriales bacterium]